MKQQSGLVGRHNIERDRDSSFKSSESASAGHQDGTAACPRDEGLNLAMSCSVVQQQENPLSGQPVTPKPFFLVQRWRDEARLHSRFAEQAA
jgi:hypothetical protein